MAYEKHEWQTGEVITADKLNHIEEGFSLTEPVIIANNPTWDLTSYQESNYTGAELFEMLGNGVWNFQLGGGEEYSKQLAITVTTSGGPTGNDIDFIFVTSIRQFHHVRFHVDDSKNATVDEYYTVSMTKE